MLYSVLQYTSFTLLKFYLYFVNENCNCDTVNDDSLVWLKVEPFHPFRQTLFIQTYFCLTFVDILDKFT